MASEIGFFEKVHLLGSFLGQSYQLYLATLFNGTTKKKKWVTEASWDKLVGVRWDTVPT